MEKARETPARPAPMMVTFAGVFEDIILIGIWDDILSFTNVQGFPSENDGSAIIVKSLPVLRDLPALINSPFSSFCSISHPKTVGPNTGAHGTSKVAGNICEVC
jgi:hypothetical protein